MRSVSVTEVPSGVQLIDVRETDEFSTGHAAGARNIPMSEFPGRVAEVDAGDTETARAIAGQVRAMMAVLGVDPLSDTWREATPTKAIDALNVLVGAELERRATARAQQDWATADEVRDRLAAAGIEVVDTPNGPEWSLKEED